MYEVGELIPTAGSSSTLVPYRVVSLCREVSLTTRTILDQHLRLKKIDIYIAKLQYMTLVAIDKP